MSTMGTNKYVAFHKLAIFNKATIELLGVAKTFISFYFRLKIVKISIDKGAD